jgi:hypothetical protein
LVILAQGIEPFELLLFLRDGLMGRWHAFCLPFVDIAGGRGQACRGVRSSDRKRKVCFVVGVCDR